MKRGAIFFVIIALLAGCSKTGEIQFCEGVSPEGKGAKCGKKFTTGELAALISTRESLGAGTVTFQVLKARENGADIIDTVTLKVKPNQQFAFANISLYEGGRYIVKALNNDKGLGEGTVEIVEE